MLARWESRGLLKAVITQNIDNLHSRAGSRNVIEFHGHTRTLSCLGCGRSVSADSVNLEHLPPRCACGGVLKPDLVFFGEDIPPQARRAADEAIERSRRPAGRRLHRRSLPGGLPSLPGSGTGSPDHRDQSSALLVHGGHADPVPRPARRPCAGRAGSRPGGLMPALLADAVVVLHFGYVLFAVGGEILVLAGGLLGWRWVRNLPLRLAHLAAVVLVAVEALLGVVCPLTEWEFRLRELAGQRVERQLSFVARLVRAIIFYDFPAWVFTLAYVGFAVLVAGSFLLFPPRRARR